MEEAGIDALVVTSKHNVQYLLGGYRFFFFDHFDAIGVSRYLPILVYVKGRPERAAYIGHRGPLPDGHFRRAGRKLEDLLDEVDAIQLAARRPIKHGARGGDVFAAAEELTRASSHGNALEFVAHGMGLISHEAPPSHRSRPGALPRL